MDVSRYAAVMLIRSLSLNKLIFEGRNLSTTSPGNLEYGCLWHKVYDKFIQLKLVLQVEAKLPHHQYVPKLFPNRDDEMHNLLECF